VKNGLAEEIAARIFFGQRRIMSGEKGPSSLIVPLDVILKRLKQNFPVSPPGVAT